MSFPSAPTVVSIASRSRYFSTMDSAMTSGDSGGEARTSPCVSRTKPSNWCRSQSVSLTESLVSARSARLV